MDFSHPSDRHVPVLLPRRSVAVFSGESRYLWTHGITPRKSDVVSAPGSLEAELAQQRLTLLKRGTRTSFTFRAVRHTPCNCSKSYVVGYIKILIYLKLYMYHILSL